MENFSAPLAQGPVSLDEAFVSVSFLPNRSPETESEDHFATLSGYRDGGIFIANYAGMSEWERHPAGDELVMVLEGSTTLVLLVDGEEVPNVLQPRQFLVVPQGLWHRFETPDGVKVMSVTPQPSEHRTTFPTS